MRGSGILMHLSSLPSNYGIGTLGSAAYRFVDFLKESKQRFWQVLPIGPTSFGDSPYQSLSVYAGNHNFIDIDMLIDEGLLKKEEAESINWGDSPHKVDYGILFKNRLNLLKKAYDRFKAHNTDEIDRFANQNKEWIFDYSLYMALKIYFGSVSWQDWDIDIKLRSTAAIKKYTNLLKDDIRFHQFVQYKFFTQWYNLKRYANDRGIKIIGDMPIYVALDSVDTWREKELFLLDQQGKPTEVAGFPPDSVTPGGQLWGNPLYNWGKLKEDGYDWWVRRFEFLSRIFDVIRIDHFRGFDSFYTIKYGQPNAKQGIWKKGPGISLFNQINHRLGKLEIIAEDLGLLTDSVATLLKESGYPGMKVLQFAFDSKDENIYLPHNYDKHCVVYTGTHDNDTLAGWFYESAPREDVDFARNYLRLHGSQNPIWEFISAAFATTGNTLIIQLQDYLELGSAARMNIPSTIGGNWCWRMVESQLNNLISERIKTLVDIYQR